MANETGSKLFLVVELSQSVGDKFEFRGAESADRADQIEDRCAEIDVLSVDLLLLLDLLLSEESSGLCDVSDEICDKIDFKVVFNHEEGIFINEFGVGVELFNKMLDKADNLVFELHKDIPT